MSEPPNHALAYDFEAPRRHVNLTLNADLVSRVEVFAPDLSATVEHLLGQYLAVASRQQTAAHERLDEVIAAVNILHHQHGFLSDEFSTL